jgi:O-glycosyl hydrolase
MHARIMLCALVSLALATPATFAATVTINPAQEHQTIDGFGGFALDLISTQSYLDKLLVDLGVTMIRTNTGEAAQSTQQWVNWLNAFKARAAHHNVNVKYICSSWSPPAWMKYNNSVSGLDASTNKLKPEHYDDYANVVKTYLDAVKAGCNIDYYAVSLQNEPAFPEPYWSCVYTPTEYRDMIKVAGPIIHAAHPNIKIFGAEHMLTNWGTFEGPLMQDAASRAQMGAFAVHGYNDGVHPEPTSGAATNWNRAAMNAGSVGLPLWMTETSGYSHNWSGAMNLAEMIYAALKYGKLAAWVWWTISGGNDPEHIMVGENPTELYYVHKHYARYIRPGAKMIGATSDDNLVFSVAFHHDANNTLSLVLINANTSSREVTLTGHGSATFRKYESTSGSATCADRGTTGATLTLPASSVTSLFAENYTPSTAARPDHSQAAVVRPRGSVLSAERYMLTGRRASRNSAGGQGIMLQRTVFSDGTARVSPVPGSR